MKCSQTVIVKTFSKTLCLRTLLALLTGATFSVGAQVSQVPLTLAPDGDARLFEYFSDTFAQLDRGFNDDPDLDGFYSISAWEASGGTDYQQVGSGFDVFVVQNPCPGDGCAEDLWVNLGLLSFEGTGDGTFPIIQLDIEFDDVITGRALIVGAPYTTVVGTPTGTVTVAGGEVTDVELTTEISFVADASSFGVGEITLTGTFSISAGRFDLNVDETAVTALGEYRGVWDVEGGLTAGSPQGVFSINAGLTGAWFDPATSGQGLLIEPIPDTSTFFAAWFTFDEATDAKVGSSEQAWLTLQGNYAVNQAQLQIFATSGGVFNAPDEVTTDAVGTGTIEFDSCTSARFAYAFDEGLGPASGEIQLIRLTPDTLCQAADAARSASPNKE